MKTLDVIATRKMLLVDKPSLKSILSMFETFIVLLGRNILKAL